MATLAEQIKSLENKIKTVLKPGSKTSHAMRGRLERAQKRLKVLKKEYKARPPSGERAKMGWKDIPTPKGSTPAFRAGEWEPTLFGKKKVKWDAGEPRPKKKYQGPAHARPHQVAKAPVVVGKPPAVAATAKPAPARRGDTKYTIRSGDTLEALARNRGTTLGAIRRANPGRFPTAASLNKIKAGEKINMPPNVGAKTPYDVKTVRKKSKEEKKVPTPKRKPTPPSRHAEEFVGTGPKSVVAPKHILKDEPKVKKAKKDVREQYPTKGTRRALKPLEGGVRYIETPFGRIKMDTSDKAFDYENPDNVTHGKKGGQVKKGVKKIKARKRAALRGHRAELRGG